MLRINKAMLDTAGKLLNSRKNHMNDGKFDYYTSDHNTVAITYGATGLGDLTTFNCKDYAFVTHEDFAKVDGIF